MMAETIAGYLAQLARRLTVDATTRTAILEEVRGHLEASLAQQEQTGVTRASAEPRAIAAFGPVEQVAGRFNAVHPVHWEPRRMIAGTAQGVVALWLLWTLLTFPLLAQQALDQDRLGAGMLATPLDPASLLFSATPLAFGLFYVLAANPVSAALLLGTFLLLFAALPFVWGARARRGWLTGLAFGLGVIVGFPWLLPAVVVRWSEMSAPSLLFSVLAIWLLLPYAIGASWLGHRLVAVRTGKIAHMEGGRAGLPALFSRLGRFQGRASRIALAAVLLILLSINGWSWLRVAVFAPPVASAQQQLLVAQQAVNFAIHQPAYLPRGLALARVSASAPTCTACSVSLIYQSQDGSQIFLTEWSALTLSMPLPAPPNYQVSGGMVGGVHPVWWLEDETTTEQQLNLTWSAGGLDYFLSSTGPFSVDELKVIAGSL